MKMIWRLFLNVCHWYTQKLLERFYWNFAQIWLIYPEVKLAHHRFNFFFAISNWWLLVWHHYHKVFEVLRSIIRYLLTWNPKAKANNAADNIFTVLLCGWASITMFFLIKQNVFIKKLVSGKSARRPEQFGLMSGKELIQREWRRCRHKKSKPIKSVVGCILRYLIGVHNK